jgi:PPE-repeat protein
MYWGPGPGTLLAASAGWEGLAAELHTAAGSYQSVVTGLTDESWMGPSSMSMLAAVTPYVVWLRGTAAQCEEAATKATAAAGAYEMAFAMTVPPPMVGANRARLLTLIATNIFGQNTPAIMVTEAEYSEMWAQDATAMYGYAANSASASALSRFTSPPQTTDPTGTGDQARVVGETAAQAGSGSQKTATQVISSVPQALQELSTPGSSAAVGTATGVGTSGATTPLSALSNLTGASSKGVAKSASVGTGSATGLLTGAASGLGSGNIYDALGLGSDVIGLGSDMAGLGADGGGLGADGGGIGMDVYGLQLDLAGAGSIVGAEGNGGLPGLGGLGDMNGLGSLGHPGGAVAGLGQADALGTLSVPPSWSDALGVAAPTPIPETNPVPGGWGAMPSSMNGNGISKLPLGGMVGRESDGAVQRIGFRHSMIPRSPVAG